MASTSSQTPSSSTSVSTTPTRWDVFLSFRGIDTRHGFTSHLYSALDRYSIPTFMDDPELRCGEMISDALIKAIQESKIYIVVLSKNYASSSWCLDELVEILNCSRTKQRLVIPVFYHILPSVVRFQNGSFKPHFKKHEDRLAGEMERVANWRLTLTEVADLSGKHINGTTSEADIVNEIVDEILLQIKPTVLDVAKHPVGLNSRVKDIAALLSSGTKGVIKIGIYGMGGVGKTTLAKAVFNDQLQLGSFKGSCFLANVRENSGTLKGLKSLQKQLINDVLKSKNKVKVSSVDEGTKLIGDRICSTKILVVIDDLDNHEKFKSLVGQFASGSVVIITTRDVETLDSIEVEKRYRYKVNELSDANSERLLFQHAFGGSEPNDTLKILSKDILRLAGGLPLALEVFGSYLYKKSEVRWKSYIDTLQRNPNKTIQQRLMISLNALELDDPLLKKMFLDIACFFIGRKTLKVVEILDTYYPYVDDKIDILKKKCLLTINDYHEFQMHDLLQDVGKEITRNNSLDDPGKHSRLWVRKDIYYVLHEDKGTEAIEGIILPSFELLFLEKEDPLKEVSFPAEALKRMSKLRFLYFDDINLTGKFERALKDLRWFRWYGCPLKCLPSDFCPQELVILELPHSKMTTMWEVNMVSNAFRKLKTLNMSFSYDLTTTPDFSTLPCLEKLKFKGCRSLKEVHISIGSLVSLVSLNLNGCVDLRNLPDTICNLRALEVLCIQGCSGLEELPVQLGKVESLRELNVRSLAVSKLPDSIGYLSKLVELELSFNEKLETLPNTICNLRSLEVLNISGCDKLERLPDQLWNLTRLSTLDILGATLLNKLPDIESSQTSSSLTKLYLSKSKITALPSGISQLSNLEVFLISCGHLLSIAELPPNLKKIYAEECTSLQRLNLSNLKQLQELDLRNCSALTEILGLTELVSLETIFLKDCRPPLLALILNKPLFQIYSGFEQKVHIELEVKKFPDWIIQSSVQGSAVEDLTEEISESEGSVEEFPDWIIQSSVQASAVENLTEEISESSVQGSAVEDLTEEISESSVQGSAVEDLTEEISESSVQGSAVEDLTEEISESSVQGSAVDDLTEEISESSVQGSAVEDLTEEISESSVQGSAVDDLTEEISESSVQGSAVEDLTEEISESSVQGSAVEDLTEEISESSVQGSAVEDLTEEISESSVQGSAVDDLTEEISESSVQGSAVEDLTEEISESSVHGSAPDISSSVNLQPNLSQNYLGLISESSVHWSAPEISSSVNLQPNLSQNYLGLILCFQSWPFYDETSYSVMTSASNIFRNRGDIYETSESSIVIVPRSIFTGTDADHTIKFTSNAFEHWIHLLYKTEDDNTTVNVEDERNTLSASDLEVEDGVHPSKRLKIA